MNDFQKVLVVDDGERSSDHALSAELAELGYASVTASLGAADDVLALISRPAAIVLQLPAKGGSAQHQSFMALADRIKARDETAGIPIVVLESRLAGSSSSSLLQNELGAMALAKPDR